MAPQPGRWGTTGVLLADFLATIGAIVFVIIYTKDNPWVFTPVLLVTLFLSIIVAVLVRQSDRTLKTVSQSWYFFSPARIAIVNQFSLGGSGQT